MKKKLKVLLVSSASMNPPYSEVTGLKAVYDLQKQLSGDVDIHVLNLVEKKELAELQNWSEAEHERTGLIFHLHQVGALARIWGLGTVFLHLKLLMTAIWLMRRERVDIVHEYSSMPLFFRKAFLYKLFCRKVKVFHTLMVNNTSPLASPRYGARGGHTDLIICPSEYLYKQLQKNHYRGSTLRKIPFGVRPDKFNQERDVPALKKSQGIVWHKKVVLYIGLLDKRKGADVFLRSIPELIKVLPDTVFVFISSPVHNGILYRHDEAKKEFQDLLDLAGRDLIFLEGRQDIPAFMKIADVFVYPIATMHGILSLPLTLLEAIISAKAIVTTNIAPMSDIFQDGENAFLINPNDYQACSRAIARILHEPSLANKFSENVKDLGQEYDLSTSAARLLGEYNNIIGL